ITHDVNIAARADRRLRLEGGRVEEDGEATGGSWQPDASAASRVADAPESDEAAGDLAARPSEAIA
ncbi:MAG: hypothetical protein ACTH31_14630, partial [Pseudoclavibacter sp.]